MKQAQQASNKPAKFYDKVFAKAETVDYQTQCYRYLLRVRNLLMQVAELQNLQVNKGLKSIEQLSERIEQEYHEQLQLLQTLRKNMAAYPAMLIDIEFALNSVGLTTDEVSIPSADQRFSLQVLARPNSGKFRFLTQTGYDKNGRSLNHDRRQAKAIKIEQQVSERMSSKLLAWRYDWFNSVSVNEFSLERSRYSNTKPENKRVLLTFNFQTPALTPNA